MATVSTVDARNQFSEVVNRVAYGKERVILTRRGKSLAAVVPIEDLDLLEELEKQLDLDDAKEALAEARERGTIPWERIKAEAGD